jgi:hypothetical protein
MAVTLQTWAAKWGVSSEALKDLVSMSFTSTTRTATTLSETAVQTNVRLSATALGWRLWRNNVGACKDEHGNHIRYGLCNESKQMNAVFKSADLVGVRPVLITPDHVGTTIGQFVAVEVKKGAWRPGSTQREQAQGAWLALVNSLGGHAVFSNGELSE